MVGHAPLKGGIGVRVPVPQQSKDYNHKATTPTITLKLKTLKGANIMVILY